MTTHRTMSERSYHEATSRSTEYSEKQNFHKRQDRGSNTLLMRFSSNYITITTSVTNCNFIAVVFTY